MDRVDSASSAAPPRRRGLMGWLGLRAGVKETDAAPVLAPAPPARGTASLHTAGEIGAFLAALDLPTTHLTLAVALDCISGSDPALLAEIDKRQSNHQPVSVEWLFEARRPPAHEDEFKAMNRLMDRLEGSLDEFGQTTHEVRTATSDYGKALRSHVNDLNGSQMPGSPLGEVIAMTRAMIERTNTIEQRIERSERETRALRRKLDQTRRDAEIDHLTGLPNRRAFEATFDREVVAARAAGEPLCLAFCDIDRFKKINDNHGHDAGDRVLRAVARVLGDISDDRCHVARHGGEEFVVLLRGRSLPEAFRLLDEARESLAERRMVNRATEVPFGKVTFSAGLADVFASRDPRDALKAADEALYVAKHEGRNRIVLAPARLGDAGSPAPPAAIAESMPPRPRAA